MISTAEYKAYVGETTTTYDTLIATLISTAQAMIERYCQRTFASASYREIHLGSDVILKHTPVTAVSKVGIGQDEGLYIRNSSTDAYSATVRVTDTSIQLVVLGGDNSDDSTLTLASYATMTALKTAIEALDKGWVVNTSDIWAASELYPTGIGISAMSGLSLYRPYELSCNYQLDAASGVVSLPTDDISAISYTAGYATIPADLKQICIDVVKSMFDSRGKDTTLQSEKIGDYAYSLGSGQGVLPDRILSSLSSWRRYV